MSPKKTPLVQQTAIGDGNIQIVGDQNVVNQTIIQRISNFFTGDTEAQRAHRNRHAMLQLVKNTWIKGVLEKSLHNEVLIELGMEERSRAVEHPWDMQLQMPNQENRVLEPSTSITEVFDDANGALLLLGDPGSGKTTMLLELARDCIERAEKDHMQPLPVVLNLSSWSNPRQLISDWVVRELTTKYFVSMELAQAWVKHDDLLLLLDGLDEVRSEYRELCVQALNSFRSQHGSTRLLVCSRLADYEALNTRLHVWDAVVLQPLTITQADEYFAQLDTHFEEVRQSLRDDPTMRELAQQPLMLSIITLAYRNASSETFSNEKLKSVDARRKHILDTYVRQMFARRGRARNELYPRDKTIKWLAWLAQKMNEERQSIFFLEELHRGWLSYPHQRLLISSYGVIVGCFCTFVAWVMGEFSSTLICLVVPSLVGVLLGGILVGRENLRIRRPVNILRWSWRRAWRGLIFGWIMGVIAGLGFLFVMSIVYLSLTRNLPGSDARIELLEIFKPSRVSYMLPRLLGGGLTLGLIGALLYGLNKEDLRTKTFSNQGVRQLTKSMFLVLLAITIVFGINCGLLGFAMSLVEDFMFGYMNYLSSISLSGLLYAMGIGAMMGSIIGVGFGLYYGGFQVANHYLIRLLLYGEGHTPLRYISFLDYCAERIFLRKVGGGYIFIHRLLMEHFAAMYVEQRK